MLVSDYHEKLSLIVNIEVKSAGGTFADAFSNQIFLIKIK